MDPLIRAINRAKGELQLPKADLGRQKAMADLAEIFGTFLFDGISFEQVDEIVKAAKEYRRKKFGAS